MEKLEQLKKEMLDAQMEYQTFMENNSRPLTKEESGDSTRTFNTFDELTIKTRVFEVTEEMLEEMKRLKDNMETTHKAYIDEFMNWERI